MVTLALYWLWCVSDFQHWRRNTGCAWTSYYSRHLEVEEPIIRTVTASCLWQTLLDIVLQRTAAALSDWNRKYRKYKVTAGIMHCCPSVWCVCLCLTLLFQMKHVALSMGRSDLDTFEIITLKMGTTHSQFKMVIKQSVCIEMGTSWQSVIIW